MSVIIDIWAGDWVKKVHQIIDCRASVHKRTGQILSLWNVTVKQCELCDVLACLMGLTSGMKEGSSSEHKS